MQYLTYFGSIDPLKLEDKVKELSKENKIDNFNNYDFSQIWEDNQGLTVSEHYIEDWKTKERIHITIKNSWQRDEKLVRQKWLIINND